jgi:hypothetical protein
MNKIIFIIITGIVFGCFAGEISYASETIRTVEIRVTDKATGSAIRNAVVYYRLSTAGVQKILGIFPKLDPIEYRDAIIEEYITDDNGMLNIPERNVPLKLYEKLYAEIIYINLDIRDEFVENNNKKESFFNFFNIHDACNVEKFYNPIDEYKGFVVFSSKTKREVEQIGIRKKFNVLWTVNDLGEEKATFIIDLEKVNNEDEKNIKEKGI